MKKIIKSVVIAASIAAVSVTSISTAQAHDINVKNRHKKHVQKQHNSNNAVVWGVIGLAAGSVNNRSSQHHSSQHRVIKKHQQYPGANYYPQAPRHTYRQKRKYNHSHQARGYDGRDHFCVVRIV